MRPRSNVRRLAYYAAVALVLAIVVTLPIAIVGRALDHQTRKLAADEAVLKADDMLLREYVVRITADEKVLHEITDTNRNSINNNSAQVGSNQLAISDLRTIVAQAKSEVIRQLDGIANVGPPTGVDTIAAKLLAILQRIDALEARIAALEKDRSSPSASPSPTARPTRSPSSSPRPSPTGEHCVVPHTAFCSSANGS